VSEQGPGHPEIERIVAPNPGPMTGEGTNTYLYGSDPCVVIDPGPDDSGHIDAIRAAAEERGGIGLILLTHSHGDHADGADSLAAAVSGHADGPGSFVAADSGGGDASAVGDESGTGSARPPAILPADGEEHAGLHALATPGHAADHVCFLAADDVCFSGDLVLGEGSTFVPPDGGSLSSYMESLRLLQSLDIALMCPGHGPWITDPAGKLAEYVEHREMRERRLLAALDRGERSREALLAEVWDDVPPELRGAAARVMEAHLQKLDAEGRLPPDVRPQSR